MKSPRRPPGPPRRPVHPGRLPRPADHLGWRRSSLLALPPTPRTRGLPVVPPRLVILPAADRTVTIAAVAPAHRPVSGRGGEQLAGGRLVVPRRGLYDRRHGGVEVDDLIVTDSGRFRGDSGSGQVDRLPFASPGELGG